MTEAFEPFSMTIDGVGCSSSGDFEVINPATEAVIARVPSATRADVDHAVDAARKAFPAWSSTPLDARRQALIAIADVLAANVEPLARLITAEQGRPLIGAQYEVQMTQMWARGVAAMDIPVKTEETPTARYETHFVPLGVVGAIVPWNFPLLMAMWKLAPALLTGNTIVLKPSPYTPLATLRFGELIRDHLPAGVVNILSGGDDLGKWITAHAGIQKIAFTGSSETGRHIVASSAATLKRVTMELGGNDAAIVMPDIDVEKVAPSLFMLAFANSGQVCTAAKRIYVHEDVYDAVAATLVGMAGQMVVGDGAQQGVHFGPLQNKAQYEKVKDLIADAHATGLKFLVGGDVADGQEGYFVPLSIIDNPPENSRIVVEEQFGPVLPLLRFKNVDDVIARANASPYGLAGSVWSADTENARRIAVRLETGTVGINSGSQPTPGVIFAGHKLSGLGSENGEDGLLEYTIAKTYVFGKD